MLPHNFLWKSLMAAKLLSFNPTYQGSNTSTKQTLRAGKPQKTINKNTQRLPMTQA